MIHVSIRYKNCFKLLKLRDSQLENMKIDEQIKDKYNSQYDSGMEEWRKLGGEEKALNIIDICHGEKYTKVLDVGSGDGGVLYWLDKNNFCENITSLEISESGIEKIKDKNLASIKNVVLFDGYKIPFEDNSFDLATCSHVMEHVEFPRTLIREIVRVSKNQVFEVPIDFSLKVDQKVAHFLSYGHINIYSPQTFRFLLQTEGLKILNFKNTLYNKKIFAFMNRDKSFGYKLKMNVKRLLWNTFPFLMNIKPNATTVRTTKSGNSISIMN